jgi:hypothetical protein
MLWSQFSAIFDHFGRKNSFFIKTQCCDNLFCIILFCFESKTQFLANFIFNHNIGPRPALIFLSLTAIALLPMKTMVKLGSHEWFTLAMVG